MKLSIPIGLVLAAIISSPSFGQCVTNHDGKYELYQGFPLGEDDFHCLIPSRLVFDELAPLGDSFCFGGCSPPERHLAQTFWLETKVVAKNSPGFDKLILERTRSAFYEAFGSVATIVLEERGPSIAAGWVDEPTEICRVNRRKPSAVLGRPYYEDVEYCVRLVQFDPFEIGRPGAAVFRMRLQADVNVTKNPSSPYREPAADEIVRYQDVLVGFSRAIKEQIDAALKAKGLSSEMRDGTLFINGDSVFNEVVGAAPKEQQ